MLFLGEIRNSILYFYSQTFQIRYYTNLMLSKVAPCDEDSTGFGVKTGLFNALELCEPGRTLSEL